MALFCYFALIKILTARRQLLTWAKLAPVIRTENLCEYNYFISGEVLQFGAKVSQAARYNYLTAIINKAL